MTSGPAIATYLYCLVHAERQPSLAGAPPGLPGTGPLRLLPAGERLWLVAADAPLARYGSAAVERGLRDLEWVSLRGAAHARVVEHFARRATTLPMKLFTLFTGDARAVAHVRGAEARVRRMLARVSGRQEWGVRVRLDPALVKRRVRRRPAPAARGAGTRFLLARKREQDVAREVLREGRVAVEDAFEALAGLADATRRRPAAELEAVLPVRFGTLLADDAALAEALTRRAPQLERALGRVTGCEQMTLRVWGEAAPAATDAADEIGGGPGTRYLAGRRQAQAQAHHVPELEPLRRRLGALVREERAERHDRPPLLATVQHLVPRGASARYIDAVNDARDSLRPSRVSVTGPWLPYAFAEEAA